MISDKPLFLFQISICGFISHAGGGRECSVYCRISNVYSCFPKVGVKGTNCKFWLCKHTWPLGSFADRPEASDSDVSRPLCKDTVGSTVAHACTLAASCRTPWQLVVDS